MLLFVVGGALLVGSLSVQRNSRPLWTNALRRAREHERGLLAQARRYWDLRLEKILNTSGRPNGWSTDRLQRVATALAAAGAIVGFAVSIEGGGVVQGVAALTVGIVAAWFAPVVLGRVLLLFARAQEIEESIQLLRTLDVYLQNGHTLRSALETSAEALPYFKPRIRQALLMWGQGPYRAIDSLQGSTSDDSVRLVITALKQAVDLGPGQLPIFLQREEEAIQRSQEALQKATQARKPILFTLYLGLPIAGYLAAFMMPFVITLAKTVTHIGGPF